MRFVFSLFLLLLTLQLNAQFYANPTPFAVDSGNYQALFLENGQRTSPWLRSDSIVPWNYENLWLYEYNGFWGIADSLLSPTVPAQFTAFRNYDSFLCVQKTDTAIIYSTQLDTLVQLPQFINLEQIPIPRYESSRQRKEYYLIQTQRGYGVMDEKWNWLLPPEYDAAFTLQNVVYLRKGNRFGFFGLNNTLIEARWTQIGRFNSFIMELKDETGQRHYFFNDGRKIPLSDSTLVYNPSFHTLKVYHQGKGYLYSRDLQPLLPHYSGEDIFSLSAAFHDHSSETRKKYLVKQHGKIGLLNENGHLLIPAEYDYLKALPEAKYIAIKDGKFGVIHQSGTVIVPFAYTYIDFKKNYLRLYKGRQKGIVDLSGKEILPTSFGEIKVTDEGFIVQNGRNYGFYNFEGQPFLPCTYSSVFPRNGSYEFRGKGGRCLVNANGLLSRLDCSKISKTGNKIKYYAGNLIVVHNLKGNKIIDTTYYSVPKRVEIKPERQERSMRLETNDYALFHDPLTGKYGAISKINDDYGVEPQFFNVHQAQGYSYARVGAHDTQKTADLTHQLKEKIHFLYPSVGNMSRSLKAYLQSSRISGWHSSEWDVIIEENDAFGFKSKNHFERYTLPYILPRSGDRVATTQTGQLSFKQGNDLMPFKDYYKKLNTCHNYIINSVQEFDLLAENPMVKMDSAQWNVYQYDITKNRFKLLDDFAYYQQIGPDLAIVQNMAGYYGLLQETGEYAIPAKADTIIPVNIDFLTYFLARQTTTEGEKKWLVYDKQNQIIPEPYEKVKVLAPNAFTIYEDGYEMVIDSTGAIIHH